MRVKSSYRMLISGFSPWIIIGAAAVLLPIVTLMTMENLNRQKQQSINLMIEKGAALIRSFEAGTRMGMRGGHGSGFQLQRLLIETAAQPDIAYLLVARTDGTVIAHSRLDLVGSRYAADLNLQSIYDASALSWRRTTSPDGDQVFEIFGKFAPLARRHNRVMHGPMMDMMDRRLPAPDLSPMVIFVGFRTDDLDAAHAADVRHTMVMAVVLLLVGCAGVLLLFLAQNYRSAHTSLVRVKVFSDNLVSRMPIGLVALDQEGRVTAINSVAETTLGVNAADVIGKAASAIMPAVLADTLTDAADPVETEVLCPVAEDRLIPMDVSAAMLTDEDGQHFGRVILFKDLTEMRALHQELEKNRRLATVGRLAAGVAHEIRNPLSSIKGFATYFKEKYRENDRDQEIALIMIQEVDRLNRVVSQLLEFSRPMRLHFQAVTLKPFVEDTFRLVGQQCTAAGIVLALTMSDEERCAVMDADKMKQVLLNLYYNALDAMTDGGHLTVRITDDEGDAVCLQVSDTGAGIDPKDLPHIFEPYFSTKKSGTGLGLAIVHNIIEAHRGKIQIDSRHGEGTTVRITLPAA
jgi:two-component system, NtrC family, sensor histidine kinase HydH